MVLGKSPVRVIALLASIALLHPVGAEEISHTLHAATASTNDLFNWHTAPLKDFGYVYQQSSLRSEFVFENVLDRTFTIDAVRNSCGCTSLVSSSDTIEPGDIISVEAVVDTTGKPEGLFEVTSRLSLRDGLGEVADVVLVMIGHVVRTHPRVIDLGTMPTYAPVERFVYLKTLPGQEMKVVSVECDDDFFNTKIIAPHFWNRLKHHKLIVAPRKGVPTGRFEKNIVVATTREYEPQMTIVVTGRILGPIEAEPESVSLGVVHGDVHVERQVTLYSTRQTRWVIKKIVNPFPNHLHIELPAPGKAERHTVVIRIIKPFPRGKISSQIVFETDDPEDDVLSVGVYGIQR